MPAEVRELTSMRHTGRYEASRSGGDGSKLENIRDDVRQATYTQLQPTVVRTANLVLISQQQKSGFQCVHVCVYVCMYVLCMHGFLILKTTLQVYSQTCEILLHHVDTQE